MGAGTEPSFGNTKGSANQQSAGDDIKLPSQEAQIKHIFANREGHLTDSPDNREKVVRVANNPDDYSGTDKYGNRWYSETEGGGEQIWVKTHNNNISDAGVNLIPREWDNETGFNSNPKKNNTWRKKK